MTRTFALGSALLTTAALCFAADLPLIKLPRGKVVMVMQPHHDDHTTDHGMGGLIARFVDEGYDVYYVRASNDEKDGTRLPAENDNINHRESVAAAKVLGMKEVISLNWRNDYSGPIPLNELRAQLIFLVRKYKPDIVLGHNPWEHYQKNPDHRNVARAMAEAFWLAGYANVHPEQLRLGVAPHQAAYLFGKARLDWGLGHAPNVAVELTGQQVRRKEKAYQTHRNVYAHPSTARSVRAALAKENLYVPEFANMDDQDAAVQMEEWHMEWISRKRGEQAGVRYAEDYYFMDEFDHLPGLKDYLRNNVQKP
jgi:LmbE family N-acetylglucosaminyl deacetylase